MTSETNDDDELVGALKRVLREEAPDPSLVEKTKGFASLHTDDEIIGVETFDSSIGVRANVRFRPSDERDLTYSFGEAGDELEVRFVNKTLMARLPAAWEAVDVFVQSPTSRTEAELDEDNFVMHFGPFESPLRLVVNCPDATYCTPWTIV